MSFRVGIGYDVHRLVENRSLIIGGVKIDYPLGLLGHSDADVLIHAIIDSLLGAIGKGDIGSHFPDTDNCFKNINSIELLKKTNIILKNEGYNIINIDSVIVAQKPKMSPYIKDMIYNISKTLDISTGIVNIKATTEEGLGFTGKELGISSKAICMVEKK
jgi:2-C-methyl-D-erythritol 2,4-cyclodiphosphate synthase